MRATLALLATLAAAVAAAGSPPEVALYSKPATVAFRRAPDGATLWTAVIADVPGVSEDAITERLSRLIGEKSECPAGWGQDQRHAEHGFMMGRVLIIEGHCKAASP